MPQVKFTNTKGLHQVSGRGSVGLRRTTELLVDQNAAGSNRSALTVDESGKIFLVPALNTGTQTIALPVASADSVGCSWTFIMTGTAGQILNIETSHASDKILAVKPKGDGDNTAISQGYDKIGFKAAAVIGSQFTITCISTTRAHAFIAHEVIDGLAANTGCINLA